MMHHETVSRADPTLGVLELWDNTCKAVLTWPGLAAGLTHSFAAGLLLGIICHIWVILMVQLDIVGMYLCFYGIL